jgi:type I restriction enzyme S subunit
MKSFNDIEIPVPSLENQERIASILSVLDDKIESNIKIMQKLPELVQSVFTSWFVEFEPYSEFETTEIGEFPSKFEVRKLSEIVNLQRGLSYKGDYLNDDEPVGHPMINLGNIKPGGGYRPEKLKYYTETPNDRYTTGPGELIISHTDMTQDREILGSPVIVPDLEKDPIIFSHHLYAVKEPKLPEEFLYPYFLSSYFKEKAESYASGTTVLSFSSDIASDAPVPIPPDEDLQRYVGLTSPLFELEDSLRKENDQIRDLLETLLPELISGRVKMST